MNEIGFHLLHFVDQTNINVTIFRKYSTQVINAIINNYSIFNPGNAFHLYICASMVKNLHTLPNGIRGVHQHYPSHRVAHLGIIIKTGTRDELPKESGLAHFIEHCIFKGTTKRKSHHILNRLDAVGGELDAYTTKEFTCIYATFLEAHFERAMELLFDLTVNSIFPEKEIEKEKDVVIDEINSYLDSPYDQIYDDFEEICFKGHPLEGSILGNKKNVKAFKREDLIRFVERQYTSNNIVVSSIGSLPHKKFVRLLQKYFGQLPASSRERPVESNGGQSGIRHVVDRNTHQTHFMLGGAAYHAHDQRRYNLYLLNNILGGPAMNSKLNLNIREKYGFTYHIESSYTVYQDKGLFYIYLGTEQAKLEKARKLVLKELQQLKQNRRSKVQLHKAKVQLFGQMAIANENNVQKMIGAGKNLLTYDLLISMEEVRRRIDAITSDNLLTTANEIFDFANFNELTYPTTS